MVQSVVSFLKQINNLPIRLTIRHYFPFDEITKDLENGELNSAESWDILREKHPHFSIAEEREEWLRASEGVVKKDGQDGGFITRANDVIAILEENKWQSVFSLGSGGGGMEYQIKKMRPDVRVVCSEYSPRAVLRLKNVFVEADDVVLFDMLSSDWKNTLDKNPHTQLHLLYRIDIHFTDTDLRKIFEDMHIAGIENVLIILCGQITAKGLYNRLIQRCIWKIKHIPYSFAGYLRTERTFFDFWNGLYSAKTTHCAGLTSFILKRI